MSEIPEDKPSLQLFLSYKRLCQFLESTDDLCISLVWDVLG